MREVALVLVAFAGTVAASLTLGELLEHHWGLAAAGAAVVAAVYAFFVLGRRRLEAGRW